MNKLIIAPIGHDFQRGNIEEIKKQNTSKANGEILYILPNFTLLKETRYRLLDEMNSITVGNILTFDDLANRYADNRLKYLSSEEVAVVVQMAINNLSEDILTEFKEVMETRGFSFEVTELILNLKSAGVNSSRMRATIADNSELLEISEIYAEYEKILTEKNLGDNSDLYSSAAAKIEKLDTLSISKVIILGFIEFRKSEMELIKRLKEKGIELIIQYPFDMFRKNRKTESLIDELRGVGFVIEQLDGVEHTTTQRLSHDGFSIKKDVYNINSKLIRASSKYYELKQAFRELKKLDKNIRPSDISIIITDAYEELIKDVAKEEGIPISIMSEESGKNLPLVRSAINFFELMMWGERSNLITFIKDEYFNQSLDIDSREMEYGVRILDYSGLNEEYEDTAPEVINFLKELNGIRKTILNNPVIESMNYLRSLNLKSRIFKSFEVHKDINVLKSSLKSIEIIENTLNSVRELSDIISIKNDVILELIIEKLYGSKYYNSAAGEGIKVSKLINTLGVKSKITYICGLDTSYPRIIKSSYLTSDRFKFNYEKLGIRNNDKYDDYDNELLKFYQAIANTDELILSYTYSDVDLKDDYSTFLQDLWNRIDVEKKDLISASGYVSNSLEDSASIRDRVVSDLHLSDSGEVELNYISEDIAGELNLLITDYVSKVNISDSVASDLYKGMIKDVGNLEFVKNKVSTSYFSASSINEYIKCPYRFYMSYISNLKPLQKEYEDKYALDRGNYYHKILKNFYTDNPDFGNYSDEQLKEKLMLEVEMYLSELKLSEDEAKVSKEIYFNKLINLLRAEEDSNKLFKVKFKPHEFEQKFIGQIGDIKVKGTIDRVDKSDDGKYIIIDYKSKGTPADTSVRQLQEIQLPLYGYFKDRENVVAGFYYSIENGDIKYPFFSAEYFEKAGRRGIVSEEQLVELYNGVEEKLIQIDRDIKSGNFVITPSKDSCKYCDYEKSCRKEEFGSEF